MLASNERNIKKNAKRNNTENSDNVLDFTIGDCFFTQKDSVRQQCVSKGESNVIQMPVLFLTLNYDSQFLRNCNTVFTELSEKSIYEKEMRGKKPLEPVFLLIYSAIMSGSLLIVEKK